MTAQAFEWLPDEAFGDPALTGLFRGPVDAWAGEWFVSAKPSVQRGREAVQSGVQRFQHGAITLAMTGPGKRRLLEAVLGVDLAQQSLTEADRHILDVLAKDVVEDLGGRLESELGAKDVQATGRGVAISVGVRNDELLALYCPRHLLVPLLKKQIAPAVSRRGGLSGRMKALGAMPVTVEAVLGRADLAISELEDLSEGDVLVLDRDLNDAAELRVAGSERAFARGKMHKHLNHTVIQL